MADALDRDMATIKRRLLKPLLRSVDGAQVRRVVKTQAKDGSWPDVDYTDQSTVHWKPIEHLRYVLLMAQAYRVTKSEFRGDAGLREAILGGLDYWLKHNFRRPWWYDVIGIPGVLVDGLLLMDEELSEGQREKGIGILNRSTLSATGQNLVWLASIVAKRAILERNPRLMARAYRRIADEIQITMKEGVQPDFSFHQHGPCLYNHGYGAGFAQDCSETAVLLAGTRFAFAQEKIEILTQYVLDGSQWMARGSTPDYGAKGREITRKGPTVSYLRSVSQNMLQFPTAREEEFRALADRSVGKRGALLVGNRHFWRSDYMAHHREAYMACARMYSKRIVNTDGLSGCDEGLKSHYIGDGCNYMFRTGKEYVDIFPVWDWQKVPGTTVEHGPERSGEPRIRGSRSFVGGVSDGMYGAAAFDFERDGLTARKAWFFFDGEFVCLGAGISCRSGNSVVTTVNQCHLKGRVTACERGKKRKVEGGEHALEDVAWVHHGGVAYVFPESVDLCIRTGTQTGSWNLLSGQFSAKPVSHEVFKLWMDHGKKPEEASYAYVVAPGLTLAAVKDYAARPVVEVLRNDSDVQAVRNRKSRVTGIVFYRPGLLAVTRTLSIGVDKACMVLVREMRGKLEISVSNPKNGKLTVGVEVNRKLEGEGVKTRGAGSQVRFDLPGGMEGGRSVTQVVS